MQVLDRSKMVYWRDLNTSSDPADRAEATEQYNETCAKIEELEYIQRKAARGSK